MEYHDPFWKRPPVIAIALVFIGPMLFSLINNLPTSTSNSTQSISKKVDTTSALYQLEQDIAKEYQQNKSKEARTCTVRDAQMALRSEGITYYAVWNGDVDNAFKATILDPKILETRDVTLILNKNTSCSLAAYY
jgi:hypothetical protein